MKGKPAFDREIENDAFLLNLRFCDVLVMKGANIRHLTSYLMEVK